MLSKKYRLNIGDFLGPGAPRAKFIERGRYFTVKGYAATPSYSRFGVVLSIKIDKRATRRNFLKRLAFRALQEGRNKLPPADYLFFVQPSAAQASKSDLVEDLMRLCQLAALKKS